MVSLSGRLAAMASTVMGKEKDEEKAEGKEVDLR
jgi:hypothetical protein